MIARYDGETRARRHVRLEMPRHDANDLVGILIRHEATRDLRMRLGRDHRLVSRSFISTPHAVDLERRAGPLSLERRVARLAKHCRRADLREIHVLVERE